MATVTELLANPPELADLELRPGDIVIRISPYAAPGIRYRVHESTRGWIGLDRIRRDGGKDRREYGFSGSPLWYQLVERPEGLEFERHGIIWRVREN